MHENEQKDYRYIVAADLHYLSPSLYDHGKAFQSLMQYNDGKLTEYGEVIINELIRVILREKPDGVLIPGDLTMNGELESLQTVCRKLSVLTDAGIRVFVIPGNHDIDHGRAASYIGEKKEPAGQISPRAFRREAGPFGYDDALAIDTDTNSYIAELSPSLRLLALDANMPSSKETIPESTLAWAEKELKKAAGKGIRTIAMTHQNLFRQHDYMERQILNHEEVEALYRKCGITLNLSGHCHLQHISEKDGLTDISTGCLMIWPLYYGILTISGDKCEYHTGKLDILQKEAEERLDQTVESMILPELKDRDIPADSLQGMMDYAKDLCADIFAGCHVRADIRKYPAAKEDWKKYAGDTFWYRFIFTEEVMRDRQ